MKFPLNIHLKIDANVYLKTCIININKDKYWLNDLLLQELYDSLPKFLELNLPKKNELKKSINIIKLDHMEYNYEFKELNLNYLIVNFNDENKKFKAKELYKFELIIYVNKIIISKNSIEKYLK